MVFNATFNNISFISCRSVLLVEKTTDLPQVTDKLYHISFFWPRVSLSLCFSVLTNGGIYNIDILCNYFSFTPYLHQTYLQVSYQHSDISEIYKMDIVSSELYLSNNFYCLHMNTLSYSVQYA
jgi:hypothetical protein